MPNYRQHYHADNYVFGASTGEPISGVVPPGHEYDYVQRTSFVTVNATTEAGANTVLTANSVTFDGSTTVLIEFYSYNVQAPASAGVAIIVYLYDGSSSIGAIARNKNNTVIAENTVHAVRRLTPSAGAHIYSIRASVGSSSGFVDAGAGGSGAAMPAFIRITKV